MCLEFWSPVNTSVNEKIFGRNIGAKIFLVGKVVQKVGLGGQVLSRKIGVKNFWSIFKFEDRL